MIVKQIYQQYVIPPNLQKHMLRVAALSSILCKNWNNKELDKDSIILACVFHDMANIIKFNFEKPQLFKEEASQVDYWKKIQAETIEKYGSNVHSATLRICQEIGLPERVLKILQDLDWNNTLKILEQENWTSAISIYCDMRIGPHGVMLIKDRIDNWKTRSNANNFSSIKKTATLLETILQKNISINLNEITDIQLNNRFNELLELEI